LSLYFKRLTKGTFEHPKTKKGYQISYEKLLLVLRGISRRKIVKRNRYSLKKEQEIRLVGNKVERFVKIE